MQGRYFIPTLAVLLARGSFWAPLAFRASVTILLLTLPISALTQTLLLVRWRYLGG